MRRYIQPEILDDLYPDDPRAIQARRDLQNFNRFMGHAGTVMRSLRAAGTPPRVVVELGTGDEYFLLRIAQQIKTGRGLRAMLVNHRPSVSSATNRRSRTRGGT